MLTQLFCHFWAVVFGVVLVEVTLALRSAAEMKRRLEFPGFASGLCWMWMQPAVEGCIHIPVLSTAS